MGTRYLWVDAICINQLDMVEKTEQVRLMAHIYNQALLVIGWLGEKECATEEGLKLMKRLQDTLDLRVWKDSDTKSEKREYWDVNIEDLLAHGLPDTIEPAWDSLVSLWELKWFSRIWVVQEILSAQDFVFLYGDEYLSGIDLLRVGLMFFNNPVFNSSRLVIPVIKSSHSSILPIISIPTL
jgi:hypothetical protein